ADPPRAPEPPHPALHNGRDDHEARPSTGPAAPEPEAEYHTRRWWPMVLVFVLVVALVAGVGYYFGRQYIDNQYYIGPSEDGRTVAIYRGIDTNIAGIELSEIQDRKSVV